LRDRERERERERVCRSRGRGRGRADSLLSREPSKAGAGFQDPRITT